MGIENGKTYPLHQFVKLTWFKLPISWCPCTWAIESDVVPSVFSCWVTMWCWPLFESPIVLVGVTVSAIVCCVDVDGELSSGSFLTVSVRMVWMLLCCPAVVCAAVADEVEVFAELVEPKFGTWIGYSHFRNFRVNWRAQLTFPIFNTRFREVTKFKMTP